jgi:ribosomal protein RSM22 (predicted rRNA methylase)
MLPPPISQTLNNIPALIDKTFPRPGRFRGSLPSDIAKLSGMLTGARGERSLSYLSRPNFLSAYLRYFLPWNLYRLCRILPSLNLPLSPGSKIIDLGSGPLTLPCALWIARPDLRDIPLEFNCIDRCAPALEAGKKLLDALCEGKKLPWKINLIREDINIKRKNVTKKGKPQSKNSTGKEKASLVCAVNLFNELYEEIPHTRTEELRQISSDIAQFLHKKTSKDGQILTIEPGVPQSGRFISLLRSAFLELNRPPQAPCTHSTACPLAAQNNKKRWCHFAFDTADTPKELQTLSAAANLPKDRLTLSYLLTGQSLPTPSSPFTAHCSLLTALVLSDPFPLPNSKFARYACSAKGLLLLTGNKNRIEKAESGSIISDIIISNERDAKSGSLIAEVK